MPRPSEVPHPDAETVEAFADQYRILVQTGEEARAWKDLAFMQGFSWYVRYLIEQNDVAMQAQVFHNGLAAWARGRDGMTGNSYSIIPSGAVIVNTGYENPNDHLGRVALIGAMYLGMMSLPEEVFRQEMLAFYQRIRSSTSRQNMRAILLSSISSESPLYLQYFKHLHLSQPLDGWNERIIDLVFYLQQETYPNSSPIPRGHILEELARLHGEITTDYSVATQASMFRHIFLFILTTEHLSADVLPVLDNLLADAVLFYRKHPTIIPFQQEIRQFRDTGQMPERLGLFLRTLLYIEVKTKKQAAGTRKLILEDLR